MPSCARDLPVESSRSSVIQQLVAPSNDNFADATVIAALPFTNTVDITDATTETGEPTPSCSIGSSGRTVWYAFTPIDARLISASVFTPFRTVFATYGGTSLAALTQLGCGDGFGGNMTFLAQTGTTYYFQVGGSDGQSGTVEFRLEAIPPPPNDNFVDATPIPVLPFDATVDITAASREEPDEPTPSCSFGSSSGRTAWYTVTPTQPGSISASIINTFSFSTVVAAYTGSSLASLAEVGCRTFGGRLTFRAEAGTTYYFQVDGLFGGAGPLEFRLEVTPPPVANFFFFPSDPSVFDVVQFIENTFDPGEVGVQSREWNFGDGTSTTTTDCCVTHSYTADGSYTVQLTVTTFDGRTASTSQTVLVRTHDVAITKFSVPKSASAGQTRAITVGINSRRYPETVEVQFFKSVPGGFQFVGVLTQSVPVRPSNRTTNFNFSYTFTSADAQVGKVTFKAVANMVGARDALPADNEAIAPPTKVTR
jgi:PKD repeat protein